MKENSEKMGPNGTVGREEDIKQARYVITYLAGY